MSRPGYPGNATDIYSREGAKYAKVFHIKKQNKIEVLGDLSAFARNKYDKPSTKPVFVHLLPSLNDSTHNE
jgi:hypothetical protein